MSTGTEQFTPKELIIRYEAALAAKRDASEQLGKWIGDICTRDGPEAAWLALGALVQPSTIEAVMPGTATMDPAVDFVAAVDSPAPAPEPGEPEREKAPARKPRKRKPDIRRGETLVTMCEPPVDPLAEFYGRVVPIAELKLKEDDIREVYYPKLSAQIRSDRFGQIDARLLTKAGAAAHRWHIAVPGDDTCDYLLLPLYDIAHNPGLAPGDGHPLAGQQVGSGDMATHRIGPVNEFIRVKV